MMLISFEMRRSPHAGRPLMNDSASWKLSNSAMGRTPLLTAIQPVGDGSGQPIHSTIVSLRPEFSSGPPAA